MNFEGDSRVQIEKDQRRGIVVIRKEAVIAILGSPVAYYAAFAKVLGGVEAGIFASQFFYWYGKGHDPQGWIYKTQIEIEDETGLTRRNQETARKKLRKLGVLQERYAGMPAKLYYRINMDVLFPLINEWFAVEVLGVDSQDGETTSDSTAPTGENTQDGGSSHPRMSDSTNQGGANTPSKDVRIGQPRMADPDNQESANPPLMGGGSRRANTKTTTKTTTKNTTETTTKNTTGDEADSASRGVAQPDTGVVVDVSDIPSWIVNEFLFFLGDERAINSADEASLRSLAEYPEHVILQAFDAAQVWLDDPSKGPIYSLARWLVGTAKRKVEDEKTRGNGVSQAPAEEEFVLLDDGVLGQGGWTEADEPELEKPMSEEELFWASVLTELETRVPRDTYDRWVSGMSLMAIEGDVYVIGLADERSQDWVENRFANTLRMTLSGRVGRAVQVRFDCQDSNGESMSG